MDGITILYFSTYEWDGRWRRKQRLAHELAGRPGVAALVYVNPPTSTSLLDVARGRFAPGHLPPTRRAHLDALLGRVGPVEDRVAVFTGSRKTLPLTRIRAVRRWRPLLQLNHRLYERRLRAALPCPRPTPLILWLTHPLQTWALDAFRHHTLCCYDWTDDWTAFDLLPVEDEQELQALNDRILLEADLVFAVSDHLYRRAKRINRHTYRMPNASDPAVMGKAAGSGEVAPDLAHLPHPIVGYVGQIADKLDFELVEALARARPRWSFVFVGDVWDTRRAQARALNALPNVHFLGRRAYHELPGYLRAFDVCAMPHRCTPLTRSMDPIKLYDYLATGKPIVSTPVAGIERFRDVIYVGDTAQAFMAGVESALQEPPALRERRLDYARHNTWSRRGREAWTLIAEHLERRTSCAVSA